MKSYPGYERLEAVYRDAVEQAAKGKGRDRHVRHGEPFHEQRMIKIAELLGDPRVLAYQVIKKIAEGLDLPPAARRHELLGSLNYLAGLVLAYDKSEASCDGALNDDSQEQVAQEQAAQKPEIGLAAREQAAREKAAKDMDDWRRIFASRELGEEFDPLTSVEELRDNLLTLTEQRCSRATLDQLKHALSTGTRIPVYALAAIMRYTMGVRWRPATGITWEVICNRVEAKSEMYSEVFPQTWARQVLAIWVVGTQLEREGRGT